MKKNVYYLSTYFIVKLLVLNFRIKFISEAKGIETTFFRINTVVYEITVNK